jgi:hypothetical protein
VRDLRTYVGERFQKATDLKPAEYCPRLRASYCKILATSS